MLYIIFDLHSYVEKMRQRHPSWTETQLLNVLYWQGTARKKLKEHIKKFNDEFRYMF